MAVEYILKILKHRASCLAVLIWVYVGVQVWHGSLLVVSASSDDVGSDFSKAEQGVAWTILAQSVKILIINASYSAICGWSSLYT